MKIKNTLTAFFLLITSANIIAQFKNEGTLFVNDATEIYINESFNFIDVPQTSRDPAHGIVSITAAALNATTPSSTNYVDGFVKLYPSASTLFYKIPLGFGSSYGPIGVLISIPQHLNSAYFLENPDVIGTDFSIEVDAISTTEYWKLSSTDVGKVTLYWTDNTDLTSILGIKAVNYLTVLGFNGTEWMVLNSDVDPELQTITTVEEVNLTSYQVFAIGSRKDLACYTIITSSENIKTWNGSSWSPSEPGISDPVVVNAAMSLASNLECYSVLLNDDITLNSGLKLTVVNGFDGTGKIIMSNLSSVIQQNPNANPPTIQMTRIVEQMRRYDYAFLGNPINDASSFFNQILNTENAATNGDFNVQTNSAFLQLRTFNLAGTAAIDATAINTPVGRGFSATVRSQAPYSTSNSAEAWYLQKENIHIKIDGIANNGSYTMTLPNSNGAIRVGNPYPSPINGTKFWELADGFVNKTLYYWTYHTERSSLAANSYNNADFATYNEAGGTAAFAGAPIPDGSILPMESVLLQSISPSVTLIIDNCVRFFDPVLPKQMNANTGNGKFRLNLQGSEDSFSQILIAYDGNKGTLNFDNGYDSYRLTGSSSELSSLIGSYRFTIQTRPAFTIEDIVPLKLDKRTEETFVISLATKEGLFETTPIFLHDKTLGIYHDLTVNSYSFDQPTTIDSERFEIVYDNGLLHTDVVPLKNVFAYIVTNTFRATANATMVEIQIYDMSGRLVDSYSDLDTKTFTSHFDKAKGIYIAKIQLADGIIATQKLINQ
jgi:hypothetical protein